MAILYPFSHPPLEREPLTRVHDFHKLDGRFHTHIQCICWYAILACVRVESRKHDFLRFKTSYSCIFFFTICRLREEDFLRSDKFSKYAHIGPFLFPKPPEPGAMNFTIGFMDIIDMHLVLLPPVGMLICWNVGIFFHFCPCPWGPAYGML